MQEQHPEKGFQDNNLSSPPSPTEKGNGTVTEVGINASGHHQELERNFSLFSIISLAITSGNAWITLGGSIVGTFPPPNTTFD